MESGLEDYSIDYGKEVYEGKLGEYSTISIRIFNVKLGCRTGPPNGTNSDAGSIRVGTFRLSNIWRSSTPC